MLRVGLTGGIGSGKSAVADLLAGYGAVIIDADLLARRAVEPGTAGLARIVEEFGPGILTPEGALDRPALGTRCAPPRPPGGGPPPPAPPGGRGGGAGGPPPAPHDAVVVHVIPLLVETGQQDRFDLIVVVDAEPEVQLRRVRARDGLDEAAARARIEAQASRQQRLAVADLVIGNSGTRAELEASVATLWRRLRTTA